MPIFRVLRCVERPVIGDIDRHMLKSFKSSLRAAVLRAAACVWRGLCLSSELRAAVLRAAACVWRGLCLSSECCGPVC